MLRGNPNFRVNTNGLMKNSDACLENACLVDFYDALKSIIDPSSSKGSPCSDAVDHGKECFSSSKNEYFDQIYYIGYIYIM